MSQRRDLHRQIMLDEDQHDERIVDASEQQSVEEFIAKFLRTVRRRRRLAACRTR